MSEESDLEKTEPASPRRLEKAREEGQVVRSRELGTFVMLMTGVLGLWIMGGTLGRKLNAVMHASLAFEPATAFDTNRMLSQFAMAIWDSLLAFMPLLLMFGVGRAQFDNQVQKFNIGAFFLDRFKGNESLVNILINHPDWQLAYKDEGALIFIKKQ